MQYKATVHNVAGSRVITIPAILAKPESINVGDLVWVTIVKEEVEA